jgi:acetolactate synthase I/II/III large subunit
MKNVAEQIADWLVEQGIEQVFTVTGGGAMFLNQALGSHPGLRCTFMHHEQSCAMAAEGYARIAGKPAVVMLTTGPGSINALNGVYGAFTDSIPMIVISGQVKRETCLSFHDLPRLRQLGDQEGPTVAMAAPVCKSATLIREARDVEEVLPAAYAQATSGRPGPVWIDIPLDVQSSKVGLAFAEPTLTTSPLDDTLEKACLAFVERLKQCHRPLLLGGTGVRIGGATELLRQLVDRAGIPLATAWTHDLIASDHRLFAGRPGTIGTRAGNFCLQNADLLLVIGSRLNIRQTSYNWDSFAKKAWIVQVDVDPSELYKPGVQADLRVEADAKTFISTLLSVLAHHSLPSFEAWGAWCRDVGERYHARREHFQKPGVPLNPYLVVDRIFRQMRDDDVVACGNASACILPFQMAHLTSNQRLFSNSGSASMGYDLPSAIGASFADRPDNRRRVICFAGDGSLQMNIQELQTLKTTRRNVVIVVLNNAGYLSIWQTHENFFGRVIGATPASGVEFPDFEAVATAYGIKAATIRTEADLELLDALLQENGPLLLNVMVDPRQEFVPRIKSRVDENGKFVTPELGDMHPFLDRDELQAVNASASAVRAAPF